MVSTEALAKVDRSGFRVLLRMAGHLRSGAGLKPQKKK